MIKTIITPVGLSLFDNFFDENKHDDKLTKSKHDSLSNKLANNYDRNIEVISDIKKKIFEFNNGRFVKSEDTSAEITSVREILKQNPNTEFAVNLIASDTIHSVIAAEIVYGILEKRKGNNSFQNLTNVNFVCDYKDYNGDIIEELRIQQKNDKKPVYFEAGLKNLMNRLDNIIEEEYDNFIINITGGYKGVIPYLTIFGQIYNIPINYIFEGSQHLIEIPQLPVEFDFLLIDESYAACKELQKQKDDELIATVEFKNMLTTTDEKKADLIFKKLKTGKLIEESNNKLQMTLLGRLLIEKYKNVRNEREGKILQLLGNIIELKLFKYFVTELGAQVQHSKKEGGFEFDIFINGKNKVLAIEVKSGGNVPLWKNKAKEDSIEHKLITGGFNHLLINNYENKNIILRVILYNQLGIKQSVCDQIEDMHKKYKEKTKNLGWYWLELKDGYENDIHWNIEESMIKPLYNCNSIKEDISNV